jgi:LemA protein
MTPLTIGIAIVVVLALWVIMTFNGLVKLRNQGKEASSDIDVQLKRRFDLIPNLVETVKGYATHESGVLEEVTRARSAMQTGGSTKDQLAADNQLTGALKSLFAVAENYPDLKANQNFAKLQDELADTENKIQASRRFYNGVVRDLNIRIESFPSNMIAGMFGFAKMEFFDAPDSETATPQVKF